MLICLLYQILERRQKCPQGLTFFGLTLNNASEARLNLFSNIHQIIFHGKGGYDFKTVYNFPIWLRKYTFKEIKEHYDKVNKPTDQSNQKTLVGKDGKVNTPAFNNATKEYKGKSSYKQLLFLIFIIKYFLNE